ncbi:MAG: hypothetical protein HND47_14670 [Chloroflexi bacterium]|nr:hypothetical protein [Chloroflexota bacterium]
MSLVTARQHLLPAPAVRGAEHGVFTAFVNQENTHVVEIQFLADQLRGEGQQVIRSFIEVRHQFARNFGDRLQTRRLGLQLLVQPVQVLRTRFHLAFQSLVGFFEALVDRNLFVAGFERGVQQGALSLEDRQHCAHDRHEEEGIEDDVLNGGVERVRQEVVDFSGARPDEQEDHKNSERDCRQAVAAGVHIRQQEEPQRSHPQKVVRALPFEDGRDANADRRNRWK